MFWKPEYSVTKMVMSVVDFLLPRKSVTKLILFKIDGPIFDFFLKQLFVSAGLLSDFSIMICTIFLYTEADNPLPVNWAATLKMRTLPLRGPPDTFQELQQR